jgi:hypothetical protein
MKFSTLAMPFTVEVLDQHGRTIGVGTRERRVIDARPAFRS